MNLLQGLVNKCSTQSTVQCKPYYRISYSVWVVYIFVIGLYHRLQHGWPCQSSLGTGGSPGVDMVDSTQEVGGGVGLGWGGGGDDNVPRTCTHGRCYATSCFLHLHTWLVLRNIMFLAFAHMVGATQHHVSCTCTHGWCYATSCFLHLHTWSVLRNIMGWGGVGVGMITFLALAHMVGATQHHVSCTCTHVWCYATSCFLHLHTWLVLRNIMFLALAHMVGATQHHVSCTCTHGRCYATSWGGVGLGWG